MRPRYILPESGSNQVRTSTPNPVPGVVARSNHAMNPENLPSKDHASSRESSLDLFTVHCPNPKALAAPLKY